MRFQVGKGGQELLRDFVTPAERSLLGAAMANTQNAIFLSRFRREVRPVPGAAATVRAIRRRGIPVVLASSAATEVIEKALRLLRLEGILTGVTSADDVEKAKPFDDIFSTAIERFRLSGRNPVAIGDTPYDIAAAHQIGLPCIALRSGGFPRRALASADAVFDHLRDMWSAGRRLFA